MPNTTLQRATRLSLIFIKEQLKEPTAFFWTILSPAALFYLLAYSKGHTPPYTSNYIETTAWFYAYISSSVAFFGFSFYIIGRRESGFTRSFIYKLEARLIFLLGQFFAYSLISILYCLAFYCLTRPSFGLLSMSEALHIAVRFYFCFLLFSIPGLLLTLPPITFQNANTFFSIASFSMLILGIYGASTSSSSSSLIQAFNPLAMANDIISHEIMDNQQLILAIVALFLSAFLLTLHNLRVNPVWSRY
ncbi:ABC transporter permease [Pseudomonas sp. PGPR40]|uniref:ABC transporter permease n=1 Tax=Pseudomonas sp. PGPR40 TaxID=2913476 RepID=UPI001EDADF70|nr:ABC transporter permease [Pseudomonas sp. PGPR40]